MLIENNIVADTVPVEVDHPHKDLVDLNPYHTVPTLTERDLAIYESSVVLDYLEERCPYPLLLPVYPVIRAKVRLLMYNIQRDWYALLSTILKPEAETAAATAARQTLQDR